MLYQIHNGTVSLDGDVILDHIDFQIKGKEKTALVGRNGAGKTTLMRLLAGELEPDTDDKVQESVVYKARRFSVEMLRQEMTEETGSTLDAWMKELFRSEDAEKRASLRRMLDRLGFDSADEGKTLSEFSGGQQTKLALVRLLLLQPELLLLDEPTNHLDMEAAEWLEEEIRKYPGAVVLISHDRFFIDQTVDSVWEVQGKKVKRYAGGYTAYRKEKLAAYDRDLRKYNEQQAEIRHLNELIERFKHKPTKASFARSKRKMLERMELIEKPEVDTSYIFTGKMEPKNLGSKWVLEADHLEIGYEKTLLELNLKIRRGQKIGIIGANGTGKTTFLKTITGQIDARKGKYSIGNHIDVGYFDQIVGENLSKKYIDVSGNQPLRDKESAAAHSVRERNEANAEKDRHDVPSVYDWFHDRFPGFLQQDARKILGQYLFTGRITATPVTELSGGEKARLALCEILTERPNFLILDEPTNHMDIPAKETLESAFRAYAGTILFVSHDRYFISQVADALLVFEDGKVLYYPFGYEHYLDRKRRFADGEGDASAMAALVQAENAALVEGMRAVPQREHHEARQMTSDEAHKDWQLRLADDPMEEARARVEELNDKLSHAATYEEYEALQAELDAATEEWTRLCGDWYDVWES